MTAGRLEGSSSFSVILLVATSACPLRAVREPAPVLLLALPCCVLVVPLQAWGWQGSEVAVVTAEDFACLFGPVSSGESLLESFFQGLEFLLSQWGTPGSRGHRAVRHQPAQGTSQGTHPQYLFI